jgi:predicted nucleic acid-binding protein
MLIVADTNVFITVVMNEPEKPWVIEVTKSAEAVAPRSLPFEIANALSRLVKRRILSQERAQFAWKAASALPASLRDIDISAALRLACERRMYAYDGFMLQCALECAAPLLTLDMRLRAAARDSGIRVVE